MANFIYKFKSTDLNYIALLQKFHGKAEIVNINGQGFFARSVSELADILRHITADEIILITRAKLNLSCMTVFPKCEKGRAFPFLDLLTEQDQTEYLRSLEFGTLHDNADELIHYFIDVPPMFTNWTPFYSIRDEDQETYEPGEGLGSSSFQWQKELNGLIFKSDMTQSKALLLLAALYEKINLSGVVHFPNQEKILIQYDNRNFILSYGKYNYISVLNIDFDINEGFLFKQHAGARDFLPSELEIQSALQEQFVAWKNRGYQGEVIDSNTLLTPKIQTEELILSWPEGVAKEHVNRSSYFFPVVKSMFQKSLIPKLFMKGDIKSLRFLICGETDLLNASYDPLKKTLLMRAAKNGDADMVAWLLRQGVDKHAKDSGGLTAAATARRFGHRKIASMIERGIVIGDTAGRMFEHRDGELTKKRTRKPREELVVVKETDDMIMTLLRPVGPGGK